MSVESSGDAGTGERSPATAGEIAVAMPHDYPYSVRRSVPEDIAGMRQTEREAFPEQWPPTDFRRQIAKLQTLYLVAVRPWTPQELAGDQPRREAEPKASRSLGSRVMARLGDAARSVGLGPIISNEVLPSPQYVAGFAGAWFVADETHIVSLGTRDSERRRGIADLLLMRISEGAVARGSRHVTLEVRKSNSAAIGLYRKHGFRETGLRERYYSDNGEDAVIMSTSPIQGEAYARMLASLARDHAARWERQVRAVS